MKNKPFRHYIPYIIGGIFGLFLRTAYFGFHGRSCTMDGHDILNAALVVIMVWCLKGLFARDNTTKRECVPKRPLAITSEGNGVCPKANLRPHSGDVQQPNRSRYALGELPPQPDSRQ